MCAQASNPPSPPEETGDRPDGSSLWTARKRLISLDGGGVRGIVSIAFLERIEKLLASRSGRGAAFRLADHFDMVGGTSTGAIIAAGLATGKSVSELKDLYFDLATRVFRRGLFRVPLIQSRFGFRPLKEILTREIGDLALDDPSIRTNLAMILKRVDTGSPWIISNLPGQPYWEDGEWGEFTGNRHYRLVDVIRASTAAPFFFGPERIPISSTVTGSFIDGGITPYNSPMIPLLMLATMGRYGLSWPLGPENLSMVSVGTGRFAQKIEARFNPAFKFAIDTLQGLIQDCQSTSLMLMQWLSEPDASWWLNGDIRDLDGEVLGGRPMMSFQRYDIQLDPEWLTEALGQKFSVDEVKKLRKMDDPGVLPHLYALASAAAEKQIAIPEPPADPRPQ